jgi:hypothetical protein
MRQLILQYVYALGFFLATVFSCALKCIDSTLLGHRKPRETNPS